MPTPFTPVPRTCEREYRNMYDTYSRIFSRLGLKFRTVAADTGAIGGTGSHEFHVLADSGEDAIAYSPASDYAANVELAEAVAPPTPRAAAYAENAESFHARQDHLRGSHRDAGTALVAVGQGACSHA